MSKELYAKIKGREVVKLFRSLEYDLSRLPPNGATIHSRDNLRNNLIGQINFLEDRGHSTANFEEYKSIHPVLHDCAIDLLHIAKNQFGVYI